MACPRGYRPEGAQPNFEELHNVLKAVTRTEGAKYEVVKEWFLACKIIDCRRVSPEYFDKCYERVAWGKGDLSLARLGQLLAMISRDTHQNLQELCDRFDSVKPIIIANIQEGLRRDGIKYISQ
ncbi:uncharacterized protein LOC113225732 [Hyposmocoma kahamanoa]|uniref:uncharacterized protein LOC113225732 n=1 Tax=Hyposmocoma kahamanoa TaxID=1477025 RepID=UPI000E6D9030|nr:uncharacterized protein LOC113225732 [Hyposmocoma kahamanoa]